MSETSICLFDLREEAEILKEYGFQVFEGSLGNPIQIPNKHHGDSENCLLHYQVPLNLHEFNIFIINQAFNERIPYRKEDHVRENYSGRNEVFLVCSHPQTLFNPRPLVSHFLGESLGKLTHPFVVISFGGELMEIEYETRTKNANGQLFFETYKYDNYSYVYGWPNRKSKYGKKVKVVSENKLTNLLESHKDDFVYHSTFEHPTIYNQTVKPDPNFFPLLVNAQDEILAFARVIGKGIWHFFFPEITNKKEFLLEFVTNILPEIAPDIFITNDKFTWLNQERYFVPNHLALIQEKEYLQVQFNKSLESLNAQIELNNVKYDFLHELLIATGDKLVVAVKMLLESIGFSNVKDMDEIATRLKEEDLQVELDNGLIVIEVKGIGGMPKDSDCQQVSKIKYRRSKERGTFDVQALTIFNHQRFTEPSVRKNPPFTDSQIQDAINDERGLVTTWQLFNAFLMIENGMMTKEHVRNSLQQIGLVRFFTDSNVIGKIKEVFQNGRVAIIDIEDKLVSVGQKLIAWDGIGYNILIIESLQINGENVNEVSNAEVGFRFSSSVKKNTFLFLPFL